jgi:hypothetical protein
MGQTFPAPVLAGQGLGEAPAICGDQFLPPHSLGQDQRFPRQLFRFSPVASMQS